MATEWLISGNPQKYDCVNAFRNLHKIDWTQSANIEVGDIVYIYVSGDEQAVRLKCKVNKVNIETPDIDDHEYYVSGEFDVSAERYMELELIKELSGDLFDRSYLKKYGFSNYQGPGRIPASGKEYLDVVQSLLKTDEMDPDKHDGSYELARETVRAYKNMGDLSDVDFRDLNLLYHMVIGTWKMRVELKKDSVDKSNLPQGEKDRLKSLLDSVWQKAKDKKYKNREGDNDSIGMFGTGFYSFYYSKDDKTAARTFLALCVEILDLNDDESIFETADKYLTQELLGLKAASASAMLHCLKPNSFPILNTNYGSNTIYEYFDISLDRKRLLTTYISNCRKIKEFRDKHFTVKNYRIYDIAAHQVNKTRSSTNIDYICVMDYLENSRAVPYSNPETERDSGKKEEYLVIKAMGQAAATELKAMAKLCNKNFKLDKCETISWLDGSNTKTRQYLWAQMKYSDYGDRPESISIFVEMSEATNKARYRYSLELKNDGSSKDVVANYHRHLDKPLPEDGSLLYVLGSNEFGRIEVLKEDQQTIKNKVTSGEYKKVQVCAIADWDDESSNDDYEKAMLDGIEKLIPYYEYVLGIERDVYWPSKDEYDPGITVEQWIEVLKDPEVTTTDSLLMLAMILEYGKPATCTQYAEYFGREKNYFSRGSSALAERVAKKTSCKKPPERKNSKWWPILYVGRDATEEKGSYVWKLRDELKAALEQIDLPEVKEYKTVSNGKKFGLNTILYGPPGTGKTYSTAKIAVSICDGDRAPDLNNYTAVMKRYKELLSEQRIAFVTFHQSYGYEEFIEGIKPVTDTNSSQTDGEKTSEIKYDVIDGVFKKFCDNARTSIITIDKPGEEYITGSTRVWKVTVKNEVRQDCFENDRIRIDFDFDSDGATAFVEDIHKGDIIITTDGSRTQINGIAVVKTDDAENLLEESNSTSRQVIWLAADIDENIKAINKNKILHRRTVARVPNMTSDDIISLAKSKHSQGNVLSLTTIKENKEPYVFVIDEINRGNISKIFGELITLIEGTKRAGAKEAMEATLPYSGDSFSVPNNVYILGTMNTADRSIALMDTALRRRFDFEEMMPNPQVLRNIGADKVIDGDKELDVAKMLEVINKRIEYLFDREHMIGHAFFTSLRGNEATIHKLASIFKKSVIPLLQEYFYEDYSKIRMILGDNGKANPEHMFLLKKESKPGQIFRGDISDVDIPDYSYEIQDKAFENIMSYIEIIG